MHQNSICHLCTDRASRSDKGDRFRTVSDLNVFYDSPSRPSWRHFSSHTPYTWSGLDSQGSWFLAAFNCKQGMTTWRRDSVGGFVENQIRNARLISVQFICLKLSMNMVEGTNSWHDGPWSLQPEKEDISIPDIPTSFCTPETYKTSNRCHQRRLFHLIMFISPATNAHILDVNL